MHQEVYIYMLLEMPELVRAAATPNRSQGSDIVVLCLIFLYEQVSKCIVNIIDYNSLPIHRYIL